MLFKTTMGQKKLKNENIKFVSNSPNLRENCLKLYFDFFDKTQKKLGHKNGCRKNADLFLIKIGKMGTKKI